MADGTIDVGAIVNARAGGKLPGFVLKWIRKIFHEDFLNEFLRRGYSGVEFCEKALEYMKVGLNIYGLNLLPEDLSRPCTFVSNHPLGGMDGVALMAILGKRFGGKVKTMVNDFLMSLEGFAPLCVPVNKMGEQTRELPQLTDELFASDNQVLLFPAGKCSREIDGKVQDVAWSKTFVTKSIQYHRDIIPVHFIGENSRHFYRMGKLSKLIKLNVAMVFLPDELYRAQGKTFSIVFGRPRPWESLDHSKTPRAWAQELREEVYELLPGEQ